MTTKCPVCGSADVRKEHVSESLPIPYGSAAAFTITQYTCNTCGESGDFTGENTSIINDAIRKSSAASASEMLEYLAGEGISTAYFERAMRLPARTAARWKSGELSSAALALLRSVRTYPWLLEVADANFETSVAKMKLFEAAASVVVSVLQEKVTEAQVGIAVYPNQVKINADLRLSGQCVMTVPTESAKQLVFTKTDLLLAAG